ncbi:MAG: hypothetical protein IPM98_10945 [Lewinellaceae bacterium]|nr:hypothetical protein [Lewinellaceae bacterium]
MAKPVVVLTRLKDSPPGFDRRLVWAYLRTVYGVSGWPPFDVYIGALTSEVAQRLDRDGVESFAFLTAANPRACLLPEGKGGEVAVWWVGV